MSSKTSYLKIFAIFTEKHLHWNLFLTLLKTQVFPVNTVKFLRTAFVIEDLWWLLLGLRKRLVSVSSLSGKNTQVNQKIQKQLFGGVL